MADERTIAPEGGKPGGEGRGRQIGMTLSALSDTIASRRGAGEESYTSRLLEGPLDDLLGKIGEESLECVLASKDLESAIASGDDDSASANLDHLRYECGDVIYHLMVLMERFGISIDEMAAELNQRMRPDERPDGCILLKEEHVKRRL